MIKNSITILPRTLEKMMDIHRDLINIGCKAVQVDFVEFDDKITQDFPNCGGFNITAHHFFLGHVEYLIYPDGTVKKF